MRTPTVRKLFAVAAALLTAALVAALPPSAARAAAHSPVRAAPRASAPAMPRSPAPATAQSAQPLVVRTRDGAVRGATGHGYRVFDGIPYAAPPVGPLRWAAPRPVARWSGVRDATRPASACPQADGEVRGGSTDEDCLYVNVTTPDSARRGHLKPVVVWLHGGGFTTGAGSSYDAHRMAVRGDVVVVTVNYRLGVLGFLARPGLPGSGTFGLADQQAALRWVRSAIGAFGGDPGNVTLAGQSAGAFSVCAQLASPSAAGLFTRAIIQSGPCTGGAQRPFAPAADPRSAAEAAGTQFAADVGCGTARDTLACLRRVEVSRLLTTQPVDQHPAYGTPLLPDDPAVAVATGRIHRVPVLIGYNHDEGNVWSAGIIQSGVQVTPATWLDVAQTFIPDPTRAPEVVRTYPVTATDGGPVFGAVVGDSNFACPTLRTGALLEARMPTWRYEFADPNPPPTAPGTPPFPLGATHAAELTYLFDLGGRTREMTEEQKQLADIMIGYWSRFARTGSPGTAGAPRWSITAVQQLAPDRIGPTHPASGHHCALWWTMP